MAKSLRILVADDELDIREYFLKILPQLGYQVVGAAQDGLELVNLSRRHKPDLILTDMRMPEMDGVTAAEIINQSYPTPVILVSAHNDPDILERLGPAHIMAYLVKPIKRADLAPTIELAAKRFAEMRIAEEGGIPNTTCDEDNE